MATATSIKQFREQLDDETGIEWKETLHPGQVNFYSKAYGLDAVYFCEGSQCQHGVFFVPEQPVKSRDISTQVLKFLQKHAYQFLPAIKLDLNKFPSTTLPPIPFVENYLVVKMQPNGNIMLKRKNSESPLAYSPGNVKNFSVSADFTLSEFLGVTQWEILTIMSLADGNIKLALKHADTNVELNVALAKEGGEFVANVTLDKSKFLYKGWEFLGNVGFKISAQLFPQQPVIPVKTSNASIISGYNPIILVGFLSTAAGMSLLAGSARYALVDVLVF